MRVISGKSKGVKLIAPAGITTRPTSDFNKESLFSMLGNSVRDCNFLDVFAGTGAIGIEALSRGASSSSFIDNNNESIKCIEANLTHTKLKENANVIKGDVLSSISSLPKEPQFDIIFMDPPYDNRKTNEIMLKILDEKLLHIDGVLILEQSSNNPVIEISSLDIHNVKKYKTAMFIFYKIKELL